MSKKGRVVKVQHFSVNDGDGIRTTIFLEGCKLKCKWCSNPDSWSNIVKLGVMKDKCVSCNRCIDVCPQNISSLFDRTQINNKCDLCGECIKVCLKDAICIMTEEMSVEEIVEEVEKDFIFFFESNGGITFSGGEPTLQIDFLRELVDIFYDKGINIAIETCGYFDWNKVNDVFEKIDHIFVDIKSMDDNIHKEYTGVSNKIILDNICRLSKLNKSMVIRVPIIYGVNDSEENIRNTALFVKQNVLGGKMELLPYHKFGIDKYKALGLEDYIYEFDEICNNHMLKLKEIVELTGVKIIEYK
ncbi:TPA: glycyl-radical enzyme activating protein [Clostridioides difficile]|uniref:glycyl-radical enzyme activating protein n=1 Tax=Clostridioides difficile TaxID=1496 RepID=UPI00038D1C53|nr:glycyl-radical enzyme activating protein [Clostridioides difficile]EGT3679065.1 glycyl-radical enzyme activating protein [Clostridioides difficile]EGT3807021.1 glycyl-radical enzyme activating protein [Clostridioides difficile]EGT3814779.1 glycyl-radical enzyme activating protein [Clostridioides difficile]EGT3825501.1 glycyl-radical enzyme activating protein [Clostridioides difficile]EGT3864110.1 glycyl-radical enzyme activating protein [Clostridioides difficile]